jgi:DNA-binding winged helix-turn-helix (wHTH) protein
MSSSIGECVTFGPFRLFATARVLERDGVNLEPGSRALDLLIALIERAGEIVKHRELIARVWRGLIVDTGNLRVQVTYLRKILDDGKQGARYIANVPGQGYSFVAPVGAPQAAVQTVTPVFRGGAGKTTVSVSASQVMPRRFTNGVCCVDLGGVVDPALVVGAVASAVGIAPEVCNPLPALRGFLRTTELLLVLDNCEHVLEAAAALAESLSSQDMRGLSDEVHIARRTLPVALSADIDLR